MEYSSKSKAVDCDDSEPQELGRDVIDMQMIVELGNTVLDLQALVRELGGSLNEAITYYEPVTTKGESILSNWRKALAKIPEELRVVNVAESNSNANHTCGTSEVGE